MSDGVFNTEILRLRRELETYQISQYVDFVKEHFLLIFVHMALSKHLHCSLSSSISVHTHSYFSESTYADDQHVFRVLPLPSILPIL